MNKPYLDPPCVFCSYTGQNYWQPGSHPPSCPWHFHGPEDERRNMLPWILMALWRRLTDFEKKSVALNSSLNNRQPW